jgi:hypothetical protein
MATAAVSVVSRSGSVVTTVRLPKDTAASAIAYDTRGDLAVALLHYPGAAGDSILLHPAKSGWRKVRVADTFLVGETSSFVTGFERDFESVDATTGAKTRLVPRSLLPGAGPTDRCSAWRHSNSGSMSRTERRPGSRSSTEETSGHDDSHSRRTIAAAGAPPPGSASRASV